MDTPPGKAYPTCIAGDGACPPEDCGGPHGYLAGLDNASSWDALEDLHTMADILREVVFDVDPPACVEPFMLGSCRVPGCWLAGAWLAVPTSF